MKAVWNWLRDEENRNVLAFIGAMIVAIPAAYTAYVGIFKGSYEEPLNIPLNEELVHLKIMTTNDYVESFFEEKEMSGLTIAVHSAENFGEGSIGLINNNELIFFPEINILKTGVPKKIGFNTFELISVADSYATVDVTQEIESVFALYEGTTPDDWVRQPNRLVVPLNGRIEKTVTETDWSYLKEINASEVILETYEVDFHGDGMRFSDYICPLAKKDNVRLLPNREGDSDYCRSHYD
jgi:hypothetical protein